MKTNSVAHKFLGLVLVGGTLAAVSARADLLSFSASYPAASGEFQIPDWSSAVTIPKFDPSLGVLNSITFRLSGTVQGSAQSENTSTSAGNDITLNLSASLQLFRPGSGISPTGWW